MRDTIVGNVLSRIFNWGPATNFDPLHQLIVIVSGVMFGVFVVGLFLLLGRYFVRWGYEEIQISRGRDSFGRRKRLPSPPELREERRKGRQRRLPGVRTRRRE